MIIDTYAMIIDDELDRLDNLANCALICRSFLARTQRHLFFTIKIPPGASPPRPETRARRCEGFCRILDCNPHIVEYVRELHVALSVFDKSWIYEDYNFVAMMEQKKRSKFPLQKLFIPGTTQLSEIDDTRAFITRFFQPFISPFITSLCIECIKNIPVDILTSCVNSKDLSLIYADLAMTAVQRQNAPRPRLERLEHNYSRIALSKILGLDSNGSHPHLDFTVLRSLVIYTDDLTNLEFEQKLIDRTCGSLQELYLRICDEQWKLSFTGFINLHNATHLRMLEMFSIFQNPEDEGDNLVTICDVLSTVPNVNSLESLRLTVHLGLFAEFVDPCAVLDANWDLFFSEITRIASGRRFRLSLHMEYSFLWRGNQQKEMYSDEEDSSDGQSREGSASNHRLPRKFRETERECQCVLERLVQEKFGRTNRNPTLIVDAQSSLFPRSCEPES